MSIENFKIKDLEIHGLTEQELLSQLEELIKNKRYIV
jgi:hypothetical protein